MSDLVIVESPTKADTISKYLGSDYRVSSSKGHVRDLPEKDLGVDIENGFEPSLVVQNKKLIRKLKKKAKNGADVYLATDNDREGEAIAYDLYYILNGKEDPEESEKFKRVIFNEITESTIKKAIKEPASIDLNKVSAQRARRILDRLVGYLISPLLSKAISGSRFEGLSAGRVQTIALEFIVDREFEIQEFVPDEYWKIEIELKNKGNVFPMELKKVDGQKPEIGSEEAAEDIEEELREGSYRVTSLKEKTKLRSPLPPFITSTLQRAASSVLNFSPTKTMSVAQQLYEGIQLEEGSEGLITYMRTDSTRVARSAQQKLRGFIEGKYGPDYLTEETRYFRKNEGAQDAHEAIRPTEVGREPDEIKRFLSKDQLKLYRLIWNRFVATQMESARYLRKRVKVKKDRFLFKVSASELMFDGFLKVLPLSPLKDEDVDLPKGLQEGDNLELSDVIPSQHFTKPPGRYTESGLIKKLEKKGIGRPSTYAGIINTVQSREYIRKKGGSFAPTMLGFIAVEFLRRFFSGTLQPELTAEMESYLDKIKNGELSKEQVLEKFYEPLKESLDEVEERLDSEEDRFEIPTDVECPECGAKMNVRYWKGSPFLSCSNWPDCSGKKSIPENVEFSFEDGELILADSLREIEKQEEKLEKEDCPRCGSPMEVKHGRYGRFLACSSSDCDKTMSVSSGVDCPNCEDGEIVERYSRRKKQRFYGCSNYPDCEFTTSKKPEKQCPSCSKGVLVESSSGDELECTNKKCDHTEGFSDSN